MLSTFPLLIDFEATLGGFVPGKALLHDGVGVRAEPVALRRVGEKSVDHLPQCRWVAGRDDVAGFPGSHDFRQAARVRDNDRDARRPLLPAR